VPNAAIIAVLTAAVVADLVKLEKWAAATVSDFCAAHGIDIVTLLVSEVANLTTTDVETYTWAPPAGRQFRTSREVRRALWALCAVREAQKRH
jgi:hypothetical protein